MGRLAVILGSSATGPAGGEVVAAAERDDVVVLSRHGSAEAYVLPHRIDHVANLRSLAAAGCDRVLSICSVGSLHAGLGVGSFVCPHDFIALQTTITSFDDARSHATPGFDSAWRAEVLAAWRESGGGDLRDGGVYWQTNGPRFETPAEVRLIAAHADLVGMTLASECVVAGELGLRYAAVCVVDNLANGIAAEPLTPAEVERHRAANATRLRDSLAAVLPTLARRAVT
ncbi:MAG: MTAP family purine nucleoside phosphorylase [Solirubrobacterales bacterium]